MVISATANNDHKTDSPTTSIVGVNCAANRISSKFENANRLKIPSASNTRLNAGWTPRTRSVRSSQETNKSEMATQIDASQRGNKSEVKARPSLGEKAKSIEFASGSKKARRPMIDVPNNSN